MQPPLKSSDYGSYSLGLRSVFLELKLVVSIFFSIIPHNTIITITITITIPITCSVWFAW